MPNGIAVCGKCGPTEQKMRKLVKTKAATSNLGPIETDCYKVAPNKKVFQHTSTAIKDQDLLPLFSRNFFPHDSVVLTLPSKQLWEILENLRSSTLSSSIQEGLFISQSITSLNFVLHTLFAFTLTMASADSFLAPSLYRCYYCQFESANNFFKYFDNKKVDQLWHQCLNCHKLFTLSWHGQPQGRTYAKKHNEDPKELKSLSCECHHCGVAHNAWPKYYNNNNHL